MNKSAKELLSATFDGTQIEDATALVRSIEIEHVMARDEANLLNAQIAVIRLSKGDLTELQRMVIAAKADFRDVIYWDSSND